MLTSQSGLKSEVVPLGLETSLALPLHGTHHPSPRQVPGDTRRPALSSCLSGHQEVIKPTSVKHHHKFGEAAASARVCPHGRAPRCAPCEGGICTADVPLGHSCARGTRWHWAETAGETWGSSGSVSLTACGTPSRSMPKIQIHLLVTSREGLGSIALLCKQA